jgi:hypothetical protein
VRPREGADGTKDETHYINIDYWLQLMLVAILAAPQLAQHGRGLSPEAWLIRNMDPETGRELKPDEKRDRARAEVEHILRGCIWTAIRLVELQSTAEEDGTLD